MWVEDTPQLAWGANFFGVLNHTWLVDHCVVRRTMLGQLLCMLGFCPLPDCSIEPCPEIAPHGVACLDSAEREPTPPSVLSILSPVSLTSAVQNIINPLQT